MIEEFMTMLHIELPKLDKICFREPKKKGYQKKRADLMGLEINDIAQQVKKRGKSYCIPWNFLRNYILEHFSEDKAINVFALAIYGMVIFPKSAGHVESTVIDLFDQVCRLCNPVPSILAEIIRSLSFCRKKGKGNFIGCVQLLYMWLRSHFWGENKIGNQLHSRLFVPNSSIL